MRESRTRKTRSVVLRRFPSVSILLRGVEAIMGFTGQLHLPGACLRLVAGAPGCAILMTKFISGFYGYLNASKPEAL